MSVRQRWVRPLALAVGVWLAAVPLLASADGSVSVELSEFSVTPGVSSVEEGAVTFTANNSGDFPHELVVIRTDLAPADLPVADNAVDESQVDVVGRIDRFTAGSSPSTTLDLEAGSYALICNLPGHYERGMSAALAVTGAGGGEGAGAAADAAGDDTSGGVPAPAASGNAGLANGVSGGAGTALAIALVLLAPAVALGARRLVGRGARSR